MKKWVSYKTTYVLLKANSGDIIPFWVPVAWVTLRQIYEMKKPAWYAYRLDADDGTFIGEFEKPKLAKKAAEVATERVLD